MANSSEAKIERDIEVRQDVDALKRLAALQNDKARFDRARKELQKEQQQLQKGVDVAQGLRRKK